MLWSSFWIGYSGLVGNLPSSYLEETKLSGTKTGREPTVWTLFFVSLLETQSQHDHGLSDVIHLLTEVPCLGTDG